LGFLLVGGTGLVVNQALLIGLTEVAGLHYVLSAILATLGSTTWNFLLADRLVFGHRRPAMGATSRYGTFLAINLALLAARGPFLVGMTEIARVNYAWSNLITLVTLTGLRLVFADQLIWRDRVSTPEPGQVAAEKTAERSARYRYNIAGVLRIDSDVVLRELAHFRTEVPGTPDVRITVGIVAPRPSTHIRFDQQGEDLVYREQLGAMGANFSLGMRDPIEIKVSPVLALSPHVVYTNIVEAFLRFLLVSKGYVLLHAAALADGQGATLMSAQTDTGKTSTVISLVRAHGYRFLSDDMVIIDAAAAEAISYPKPMTLSFHTMGVAKDGHLTVADRAKLSVQSRLHSKSGRQVGRALGRWNIPIMTINSAVQAVVPPPKHRIEALFPCEVGGRAPIRNVVLMERGPELLEQLPLDETIRRLIDNTDDAYGFPPFATFAPRIRIGEDDYDALRRKEVELLTQAVANARRWHLRVPGHEWADHLPSLIDGTALVGVGPGIPEPQRRLVPVGPGFVEPQRRLVPVGPGETPAVNPAELALAFQAQDSTLAELS